jgi:hypothetical protein
LGADGRPLSETEALLGKRMSLEEIAEKLNAERIPYAPL